MPDARYFSVESMFLVLIRIRNIVIPTPAGGDYTEREKPKSVILFRNAEIIYRVLEVPERFSAVQRTEKNSSLALILHLIREILHDVIFQLP